MSDYVQLVNIGNFDEISIKEFGEEVLVMVSNFVVKLIYKELLVDDFKVCCLDIIKVREIFGWEFKILRVEGLKRIFEYFKEVVKID